MNVLRNLLSNKLHYQGYKLTFLFLFIGIILSAQNSYQSFPAAGFKVKCGCNLRVNTLFIQTAKQQGMNNIAAAYICAENEDDPETDVIVNINIYDESASYNKIKPENHPYFTRKCLEKYAENLSKAGIQNSYTTFQGVTAIEYTFDQNGLPTKAIMFYKNKKSYLLQVGTRNNLNTKFNNLKQSFVLL